MTTRRVALAAYLALGIVWGLSLLFMEVALEVITPGQTSLLRLVFGAIPIAAIAIVQRRLRWWHWRHTHHFAVMSVLAASLYFYSFASGTQRLDSGVAGAISGIIPLFATIGAAALVAGEDITRGKAAGLAIGMAGIVLLAEPWSAVRWTPAVSCGCSSAVPAWGCRAYAKRFVTPLGVHPAASASYQMVLAALGLGVCIDLRGITSIVGNPGALLSTALGLGMLSTGVAFELYYTAVAGLGDATASTATYIPPVIAMAIGVVALNEPLRPWGVPGLLLVVAGAAAAHRGRSNGGPGPKGRTAAVATPQD